MIELATAARHGLLVCHRCGQLSRNVRAYTMACARCGTTVTLRESEGLKKAGAYLLAAAILYIPANTLPIMHTEAINVSEDDTILSGVQALIHTGSWPLAALVFFASVMVPILKLAALSVLILSVRFRWDVHPRSLGVLYRLVEFIGRWSLLDIYVLTLLVALVQWEGIATIEPRAGALAFASVVVLTILSARSFDPRLLWDLYDAREHGRDRQ